MMETSWDTYIFFYKKCQKRKDGKDMKYEIPEMEVMWIDSQVVVLGSNGEGESTGGGNAPGYDWGE